MNEITEWQCTYDTAAAPTTTIIIFERIFFMLPLSTKHFHNSQKSAKMRHTHTHTQSWGLKILQLNKDVSQLFTQPFFTRCVLVSCSFFCRSRSCHGDFLWITWNVGLVVFRSPTFSEMYLEGLKWFVSPRQCDKCSPGFSTTPASLNLDPLGRLFNS